MLFQFNGAFSIFRHIPLDYVLWGFNMFGQLIGAHFEGTRNVWSCWGKITKFQLLSPTPAVKSPLPPPHLTIPTPVHCDLSPAMGAGRTLSEVFHFLMWVTQYWFWCWCSELLYNSSHTVGVSSAILKSKKSSLTGEIGIKIDTNSIPFSCCSKMYFIHKSVRKWYEIKKVLLPHPSNDKGTHIAHEIFEGAQAFSQLWRILLPIFQHLRSWDKRKAILFSHKLVSTRTCTHK